MILSVDNPYLILTEQKYIFKFMFPNNFINMNFIIICNIPGNIKYFHPQLNLNHWDKTSKTRRKELGHEFTGGPFLHVICHPLDTYIDIFLSDNSFYFLMNALKTLFYFAQWKMRKCCSNLNRFILYIM